MTYQAAWVRPPDVITILPQRNHYDATGASYSSIQIRSASHHVAAEYER